MNSSPLWGSNPRPYAYEAHALPTELRRRAIRTTPARSSRACARQRQRARIISTTGIGKKPRGRPNKREGSDARPPRVPTFGHARAQQDRVEQRPRSFLKWRPMQRMAPARILKGLRAHKQTTSNVRRAPRASRARSARARKAFARAALNNQSPTINRALPLAIMDTLGIEPRASRMLSGCDTTTPCAQLNQNTQFTQRLAPPSLP